MYPAFERLGTFVFKRWAILFFILFAMITVSSISLYPYIRATATVPVGLTRDRNIKSTTVDIAVIICGDRLEESTTMLKSAVIFSRTHLVFHVFTEDNLRKPIEDKINGWSGNQRHRVKVNMHSIQFPLTTNCSSCSFEKWRTLFKPCAAQRLFFPVVLPDVDSVIYMDSDTLFLSPVENTWALFNRFLPGQFAGISPEVSDYYRGKPIPYCTATGVNSGVFLMNLTRIRASEWMNKITEYYNKYRRQLVLGDQDLINIYCHFHTDQFYLLPCTYNYRGTFCPANKMCDEAETTGVSILHGNVAAFHNELFPAEKGIYKSFREFDTTNETLFDLYDNMLTNMKPYASTECGKRPILFTRNLKKYANEQAVLMKQGT